MAPRSELSVVTRPADAQYIGVVLGIKGEAKGYVTLVLSDKLRTLLKMIPLPRKMSKTPDQVEEFNVYAYVKQLIDGNDVSVLLGVADEVVKVMDTLKFYIPTLKDMSMGLKLSLELIRRYLPEARSAVSIWMSSPWIRAAMSRVPWRWNPAI